jgi:hypothetical protein
VTPITFRRWLAVGTMPQFQFEGTGYVLQADMDAFEACQCRKMAVPSVRRRNSPRRSRRSWPCVRWQGC